MSGPDRSLRSKASPAGLAGLAVACVATCWGLPVLLAAGSAVTILSLGLRSWVLITAGIVVASVGALHWRSRQRRCHPRAGVSGRTPEV